MKERRTEGNGVLGLEGGLNTRSLESGSQIPAPPRPLSYIQFHTRHPPFPRELQAWGLTTQATAPNSEKEKRHIPGKFEERVLNLRPRLHVGTLHSTE